MSNTIAQTSSTLDFTIHIIASFIAIGCECHSIEWWRENWEGVADKWDVENAIDYIDALSEMGVAIVEE